MATVATASTLCWTQRLKNGRNPVTSDRAKGAVVAETGTLSPEYCINVMHFAKRVPPSSA